MPIRPRKEKEGLGHIPFFGIAFIIFILDQWTKLIVSNHFSLGDSIPVIHGLFDLTLVHNTGAAFGFFKQAKYILIGTSVLSIAFLVFFYFAGTERGMIWKFSLGLILGGALGNLRDRLFRGYVIDFLDFYVGSHHWPAFNVADSAITIGVFLLIIHFLVKPRDKMTS